MALPSEKRFPDSTPDLAALLRAGQLTNEEILQAVRDLNPRNTGDQVFTAKAGIRNYGQQVVDVSTALANIVTTISPPTYRLTFTKIPPLITQLDARINDPEAQPLDILEAGNVIESDVPIERIFLTTDPDVADGEINILAGNLQIFPRIPGGAGTFPPTRGDTTKLCDDDPVTVKACDGVAVPTGQLEILRGLFFVEDGTSAADSIEWGIIGGASSIEPLFLRLGGPFANPHLIGDDSDFTASIMSFLPMHLYAGTRVRLRLRRGVAGVLKGEMKEIKESYTVPFRPTGF